MYLKVHPVLTLPDIENPSAMIPEPDYHAILGVSTDASADEIRRAYRSLSPEFHPDKNPGNTTAEDMFKIIREAYDNLLDSKGRKKHELPPLDLDLLHHTEITGIRFYAMDDQGRMISLARDVAAKKLLPGKSVSTDTEPYLRVDLKGSKKIDIDTSLTIILSEDRTLELYLESGDAVVYEGQGYTPSLGQNDFVFDDFEGKIGIPQALDLEVRVHSYSDSSVCGIIGHRGRLDIHHSKIELTVEGPLGLNPEKMDNDTKMAIKGFIFAHDDELCCGPCCLCGLFGSFDY